MGPERLQAILEEDDQPQEDITPEVPEGDRIPEQPPEPDQEAEKDGKGAPKLQEPVKGQVRKLTEYFNSIGGQSTQKAPKSTQCGAGTPKATKNKKISGGVNKTPTRKRKNKLEEPARAKMELALRTFLRKKPPDKATIEGGEEEIL